MKDDSSISKLIKGKKTEEARKAIEKYYKNDPKLYFYYLGLSFLPEKDYNKVILFLSTARNNGFRNYLLHYNLGIAYLGKEDHKNAEDNFIESIKLNSKFLGSYINLAHIYMIKNDNKKAYRVIKTALTQSDDSKLDVIEKKLLRSLSADL